MSIAQTTTIQAYQLRKGGTPARMAILRMIAAESANNRNETTRLQPGDWRGARAYGLYSYESAYGALSQDANGKTAVWYCHTGEQFRGERFADECEGGPDHRGWYTNHEGWCGKDDSGIARGIVARLTHGRFIAGYYWGDNGERVYFPDVFDDERAAARAADEHARVFAKSAQEDSARFSRMSDAETNCADLCEKLRDALALRRIGRRDSDDVRDIIATLREAREELETATREYEGA